VHSSCAVTLCAGLGRTHNLEFAIMQPFVRHDLGAQHKALLVYANKLIAEN